MALVVETGAVVSEANSYVSLADAQTYVADRGLNVELTEGHLLGGADYVNSYRTRFKGQKLTSGLSSMQFPRTNLRLDGILLANDVIPDVVIDAQIQSAIEIAQGRDPLGTISARSVRRQRAGPTEREFFKDAGSDLDSFDYRKIDALLLPLLNDDLTRVFR